MTRRVDSSYWVARDTTTQQYIAFDHFGKTTPSVEDAHRFVSIEEAANELFMASSRGSRANWKLDDIELTRLFVRELVGNSSKSWKEVKPLLPKETLEWAEQQKEKKVAKEDEPPKTFKEKCRQWANEDDISFSSGMMGAFIGVFLLSYAASYGLAAYGFNTDENVLFCALYLTGAAPVFGALCLAVIIFSSRTIDIFFLQNKKK